jgi:transketolase
MTQNEVSRLEAAAKEIRKKTIDTIGYLGVGHIGGALSIVELLAALYYREMRVDSASPRMEDRDRLVLSKGHAGPALYSALALKGFFPIEWLHTLNKGGTNLPSHCDRNRTPGIDMTTGSLGQGISAACGIALANRIDKREVYTFAIIGDGESDEGEVWEAAMFAGHYGLSRLVAFTDNNRMQIDGTTAEVMSVDGKPGADGSLGPCRLDAKWAAFGWAAERVAGHDVGAICDAIEAAKARVAKGDPRPTMIVLDTVKGKGAAFCEGQVGSHNMNFDYETAQKAIAALGQ